MNPTINPENHAHFTRANDTWEYAWKECMEANNSIHNYLDEKLGFHRLDWAGRYATFLNNLGISHQTDNGWWSKAAVMPENLEAFIRYEDPKDEDLEWQVRVCDLIGFIRKISKLGPFNARFISVDKLVEEWKNNGDIN